MDRQQNRSRPNDYYYDDDDDEEDDHEGNCPF